MLGLPWPPNERLRSLLLREEEPLAPNFELELRRLDPVRRRDDALLTTEATGFLTRLDLDLDLCLDNRPPRVNILSSMPDLRLAMLDVLTVRRLLLEVELGLAPKRLREASLCLDTVLDLDLPRAIYLLSQRNFLEKIIC
jgi:hypothetical protein